MQWKSSPRRPGVRQVKPRRRSVATGMLGQTCRTPGVVRLWTRPVGSPAEHLRKGQTRFLPPKFRTNAGVALKGTFDAVSEEWQQGVRLGSGFAILQDTSQTKRPIRSGSRSRMEAFAEQLQAIPGSCCHPGRFPGAQRGARGQRLGFRPLLSGDAERRPCQSAWLPRNCRRTRRVGPADERWRLVEDRRRQGRCAVSRSRRRRTLDRGGTAGAIPG